MQQWNQILVLTERGLPDAAIARKLDAYRSYLAERLNDFPDLNARVLFREIAAQGYDGGYERVKIACRERRGDPVVEGTARFETGPGEQAQADWLETKHHVEHERRRSRLCGFIYVLGYSRWSFLEFTVSEAQQVLFRCFEAAFRAAAECRPRSWSTT